LHKETQMLHKPGFIRFISYHHKAIFNLEFASKIFLYRIVTHREDNF